MVGNVQICGFSESADGQVSFPMQGCCPKGSNGHELHVGGFAGPGDWSGRVTVAYLKDLEHQSRLRAETRLMSALAPEDVSAVETGHMSPAETRMSVLATEEVSAVVTGQAPSLRQDRCPQLRQDGCLLLGQDRCILWRHAGRRRVATTHICPVPAAHVCCVLTTDICPVSTEDICPLQLS